MRFAAALLGLIVAAGCGSDGGAVARDERYLVTMDAVSPMAPGDAGVLRLRVETRNGWHIALEAPARLSLEAPESLAFEPASLELEHAESAGDEAFEMTTVLRAERAGHSIARGRLKFGICRERNGICVAIDQELELPIEVAFR